MSLQFVLGNSGSGKTVYMYQKLVEKAEKNPKKNYLVIVPEQFTMQTQRELVDLSNQHAIMNIDVLSFQRLAYRIFDELGKKNLVVLEEVGKNLVLRKVAQQKEEELVVLRPNLNRMGYISELKSLLSEFTQYNVTPDRLQELLDQKAASDVFLAKLKDVITMYRGFEEFINGTYITSEEILTVLCNVANESEILKNSEIVFDEFTGFTPIQNQLIQKLLVISDSIQVSLTIDSQEDFYHSRGMQDLFEMPKKTIQRLLQMCEELHVDVLDPVVLQKGDQKRFIKAPSLFFMEQNLFRSYYHKKHDPIEEIQIASVKNPREELIYTARQICQLVRKEGYRYRDIAVVTGSVENYENYIQSIFEKYEIPYFMDTTKKLLFHPFIEFIRASLEVIEKDFSCESVFRFLRCGFCDLEMEQVDRLENYIIATGIRGKSMWGKRFLRMPKRDSRVNLEEMEALRLKITQLLFPLAEIFSDKSATVGMQIKVLYQMIVSLNVESKLRKKEQDYLEQGLQTKSKEYSQIYRLIMDLFDKIYALLGEESMDIREFVEILDAGLDAAKVASIPPGYDSVTIGDIERTRLNHVKVLFFIGVNDGIIPKAVAQGGIISPRERELLAQEKIELSPNAREQVFIQKYYLYLNLTKPSERLYISYAKADSEGKILRPSYLISTINRMFPNITVQDIEELEKEAEFYTMQSAFDYLTKGEQDDNWFALAKWFMENDSNRFQQLLDAAYMHYEDEPISHVIAQALYSKNLEGSVTRLERFAACAYAHFLEYGLKVKEREECSFASMDMGNIYHQALQNYGMKLMETKYDWFTVPQDMMEQLASDSFAQAIAEYPSLTMYATAQNKHQIERMSHILQQTIWALTRQIRKGKFAPAAFEISFSQENELEAIHFQLSKEEKMRLSGRIDRVDLCDSDGKIYVKVIDYKSGSTKFDLVKIYQGTQLQLVVYINAAMELEKKRHEHKEVIPGGLFYYHIDDPVIELQEELSEEEYRQKILEALRPDGLVNREEAVYRAMDDEFEEKSDVIPVSLTKKGTIYESRSKVAWTEEFQLIGDYVRERIKESGREIYDGKVSINPYMAKGETSCMYCPYHSICGFDQKIPGFQMRNLEDLKNEQVYERMETYLALQKRGEE